MEFWAVRRLKLRYPLYGDFVHLKLVHWSIQTASIVCSVVRILIFAEQTRKPIDQEQSEVAWAYCTDYDVLLISISEFKCIFSQILNRRVNFS